MTQPAQCGTTSGYERHRRNNETPCHHCATARREYQREWRSRGVLYQHTRGIVVPKLLLAEMYLNAPYELQERIEAELGRRRIDQLVKLYDANEVAA